MPEQKKKKTYVVHVRVEDDCEPTPLSLDDVAAAVGVSPRLSGLKVLGINVHNEDGKLLFVRKIKDA